MVQPQCSPCGAQLARTQLAEWQRTSSSLLVDHGVTGPPCLRQCITLILLSTHTHCTVCHCTHVLVDVRNTNDRKANLY